MGSKTAYLETAQLEHNLRISTFTPPATIYFLASTALFDPDLTGATVIEPSGGSYARVSKANDNTTWDAVSGSNPASTSNLIVVNFAVATADWGLILSVYVADSATLGAGNLLYGTNVAGAGIPIASGSQFEIPIGGFLIREK